jgi:hypothetical protein
VAVPPLTQDALQRFAEALATAVHWACVRWRRSQEPSDADDASALLDELTQEAEVERGPAPSRPQRVDLRPRTGGTLAVPSPRPPPMRPSFAAIALLIACAPTGPSKRAAADTASVATTPTPAPGVDSAHSDPTPPAPTDTGSTPGTKPGDTAATGTTPTGTTPTGTTPTGTTPTGTTSTSDTGTPPPRPCRSVPPSAAGLPPSVKLCGSVGSGLGFPLSNVGPVQGDGRDVLAVEHDGLIHLLGPLPPSGDHAVPALAEATIDCGSHAAPAGDTDRDGVADLWAWRHLFRGPVRGALTCTDSAAGLDESFSRYTGGFDADGDGWMDVAAGVDSMGFVVHYGPFDGRVPGAGRPRADPRNTTRALWASCEPGTTEPIVLGPLAGPGSMVLGLVDHTFKSECGATYVLYDLTGTRGRGLDRGDALAYGNGTHLIGVGDWDGDGFQDLAPYYELIRGPIEGAMWHFDSMYVLAPGEYLRVAATVPDIDGDGVHELFAYWDRPDPIFVVLPSSAPRSGAIDVGAHAAVLAVPDDVGYVIADHAVGGDFDGDGLGDIAGVSPFAEDHFGGVYIWYGRDITFP